MEESAATADKAATIEALLPDSIAVVEGVESAEDSVDAAVAFNDAARKLLHVVEATLADMRRKRQATRNLLDRIEAHLGSTHGGG